MTTEEIKQAASDYATMRCANDFKAEISARAGFVHGAKWAAEKARKEERERHKGLITLLTQIRSMLQQGSAGSHYANRITEALKEAGYETEERK